MNTNNFTLSAVDVWKSSFEVFKKYWTVFLGTAAVSFLLQVVNSAFSYVMYQPYEVEQLNEFTDQMETVVDYELVPMGTVVAVNSLNALVVVVGIILGYNLIKMILRMYDNKEVKVSEYWEKPDGNFWKYIRTILLFALRVAIPLVIVFAAYGAIRLFSSMYGLENNVLVGFLTVLLPVLAVILFFYAFYWAVIYGQAVYLAIENKASSAKQALSMSEEITVGKFWKIFWFNFRVGLMGIGIILLGLIALIVGVIPAMFIVMSTLYIVAVTLYKKLYEAKYGSADNTASQD